MRVMRRMHGTALENIWLWAQETNPDENLLGAGGDARPILAKAMGADAYAPVFAQQHADALFKWLRPSQPDSVRASATGAST